MLVVFVVWSSFSAYAWTEVSVDFNMDTYLLDAGDIIAGYREVSKQYFAQKGAWIGFYTFSGENDDLLSEESQLKQLWLEDSVQRCKDCLKPWISPGSLNSVWHEFRSWIDHGYCDLAADGFDPFLKVLDREIFV